MSLNLRAILFLKSIASFFVQQPPTAEFDGLTILLAYKFHVIHKVAGFPTKNYYFVKEKNKKNFFCTFVPLAAFPWHFSVSFFLFTTWFGFQLRFLCWRLGTLFKCESISQISANKCLYIVINKITQHKKDIRNVWWFYANLWTFENIYIRMLRKVENPLFW